MAIGGTVVLKLEGLESYRAQISQLSPKQQRRLWRDALRATGKSIIEREAKRNLRAMGLRRHASELSVQVSVTDFRAKVSVAARRGTRLGRLGHLIEKGVRPHEIRTRRKPGTTVRKRSLVRGDVFFGPRVQHPGVRARPWLEPALLENVPAVMEDVTRRVIANVEKAKTYRATAYIRQAHRAK